MKALLLAVTFLFASVAAAQPPTSDPEDARDRPPPGGPADILAPQPDQDMPEGQAPEDPLHALLSGHGPQVAVAEPSGEVPAGSIAVTVVDMAGQPIASQRVEVGTMNQTGAREQVVGRTDENGTYTFVGLPTGSTQAYRVRAPHSGAVYASTPFQLPPNVGYRVRLTRIPTTTEDARVIQVVGQASVEIRDQRLHIVQQAQLLNAGEETYVFPEDGLLFRLPAGHMAFQAEAVMTDQRFVPVEGEGFRLQGSLPPGRVTLTWGYDLPIDGTVSSFALPVPFRTMAFRVFCEAPKGLVFEVSGFPPAETYEDQGRRVFETFVRRQPSDPRMESVQVTLRGIPGPGPYRFIALGAGFILIVAGFLFLALGGSDRKAIEVARKARKEQLLDEALKLERMFAASEIGPKYRTREREAIELELALLLRDEAAQKQKAPSRAART